jgi:MFS family permease
MGRAGLLVGVSLFWLPLSLLSDGLTNLLVPHALAAHPRKATVLGLVTFVGLLGAMAVLPAAGAWSDRTRARRGRRGLLVLGTLALLPGLAVLAVADGPFGLAVGFVLTMLAAGVAQAAYQGYVPDLVPAGRRGLAAGLKGFMDVGGALLAFVLLGQLLEAGGRPAAAAAVAGSAAATLVAVLLLVREEPVAGPPPAVERNPFRLDLVAHRRFAWLVASRFLFLLGTYAVGRFFLFFVAERLGLDPDRGAAEAGLLLGALTLVTVLAAPPAGWASDRFGRLPLMLVGVLLSVLGVLSLLRAADQVTILAGGALMALGSAAFAGANWALAADLAPPAEAGRFLGLASVGTTGAAAAAGLLGPLVDAAGFPALFVAAACAFAASGWAARGTNPPEVRTHVGRPEAALP